MPSQKAMTRRGILMGGASMLALAYALPAAALPPGMPGHGHPHTSSGGGGGALPAVTVANTSSSALTAPYVQFAHGFKRGDLTDGNVLSITDDLGGAVTYTAARRANWPDLPTNRSLVDLFCKLPNNIPGKLAISSLTISGTTATCTTASAHGLSTGNKVLIQPQNTDTTVGAPSNLYCGLVPVTVTGASTFTYTVIGTAPSGSATVGMEMCYTRTLTLTSATGSWNDSLPAGKTSTNILTDLQTNFDNITLELTDFADSTGTAVGSGVYQANFFTCIAQAGTDKLRVVATGPTVCDFVGIMKFADTVGGARHSTIAGWFYVSALLNPSTGAVVEVHARAFIDQSLLNVAMSYYTFRSRMKLGSTVVRSLGLSNDATIDGKTQTFAPTAVNTSTDRINIPNHGFQGGERVLLTTTGTLPAPFVVGTNYAVIWVDSNNIALTTTFGEPNQFGTSTPLNITSQGTGTHTVTCWQQSPYSTRMAYVASHGRPDRWTGATGALSPISYHVIHDMNYMQQARLVPPVDLTINLNNPIAEISSGLQVTGALKSRYVFGSPGVLQYAQNAGGSGSYHEYGAAFTNIPCRRCRYPNDLGYAQTLRTSALAMGSWDLFLTRDDTNWRPPVVNNGPTRTGTAYPGMSASEPTGWFFNGSALGVYTSPSSTLHNPGLGFVSYDHRYLLFYPLYMFEGRHEIHDLMVMDVFQFMTGHSTVSYTGPGTQVITKIIVNGSTTYYSLVPTSAPREDAWGLCSGIYCLVLSDPNAPEHAVVKDYVDDTLAAMNYLINVDGAAHDPNWLNFGTFSLYDVMQRGPGYAWANNNDAVNMLFEGYLSMAVANCYRLYPSANFQAIAPHMAKFTDNLYRNIHNSWMSNSFQLRAKYASGTHNANSAFFVPDFNQPLLLDQNLDAILYRTDGTVWGCFNNGFQPVMYPIAGERHSVNDQTFANAAPNFFVGPPPELTFADSYYVRNPSGTYYGWQYATTNSDTTIVPSYSSVSSSTISTTMGTGTTAVTVGAVLTGMNTTYPLIVITSGAGTEICQVSAGSGTTNLTIVRGKYGTTALAHGAGATVYVPYLGGCWRDLQLRDVPFPPTGHGWRTPPGDGDAPIDGYRTMMRCGAAIWAMNGIIPWTAFNNADAWFQDALDTVGINGPTAFAANNALMDSVNITL